MFQRCEALDVEPIVTVAHDGEGEISYRRLLTRKDVLGPLNFADYTIVPPGVTVGEHTHAENEEEYYLIIKGSGVMIQDGESFHVTAGSFIRNNPGGRHGITNTGDEPLHMFVFEVAL
jgi:mannose-6-phosphate isomerase-like protein (cupin superfamily)